MSMVYAKSVILQAYSWLILILDFSLMVLKAFIMWVGIFYRVLFPATLKPIKGKIVLVG